MSETSNLRDDQGQRNRPSEKKGGGVGEGVHPTDRPNHPFVPAVPPTKPTHEVQWKRNPIVTNKLDSTDVPTDGTAEFWMQAGAENGMRSWDLAVARLLDGRTWLTTGQVLERAKQWNRANMQATGGSSFPYRAQDIVMSLYLAAEYGLVEVRVEERIPD